MDVWGELVPSKIFNPPFPVLKAGHSVSYSYICDVCMEWVILMGGFLSIFFLIPVWLVYSSYIYMYIHVHCTHTFREEVLMVYLLGSPQEELRD